VIVEGDEIAVAHPELRAIGVLGHVPAAPTPNRSVPSVEDRPDAFPRSTRTNGRLSWRW
jgi:hypothetical protein